MTAILRREFYSYFTSPIGYIYLSVFYFFSGIFFNSVVTSNSTDISPVFSSLFTILLVLIPLLIKELAMLIGGMLVIKRQKVVAQAVWYGKLATVVIFVSAFVRLLVRDCLAVDIAVCAVILTMLVFSLLMYYFKIFRGKYNETIRKQ